MPPPINGPSASAPSNALPGDASYEEVMRANVALHSQLAATYKEHEPHYRPENVEHVRAVLAGLVQRLFQRDRRQPLAARSITSWHWYPAP